MTSDNAAEMRQQALASLMPRDDLWDADGWQHYVARRHDRTAFEAIGRKAYETMSGRERGLYDVQRKILACNLPKMETPMAAPVRRQISITVTRNTLSDDPGPRAGTFLSANPGLGKSTLAREIAADFDEEVRGMAEVMPNAFGHHDRWIPVVWISVPSKVTIISLCRRILYFFGYVMPKGARQSELEEKVLTLIRACGVQLVVLDDITRLNMNRDSDKEVADWIRHLMEASVSILGIGVDIETSGLAKFTERVPTEARAALKQNRTRFSIHSLGRFTYDTPDDINDWVAHLQGLEASLPLLDGTVGMLSGDCADLLFARSNGVIGTLHGLVSSACLEVIGRPVDQGGEVISDEDIMSVVVDIAAEENYQASLATTPRTRAKRNKGSKQRPNSAYDGNPRERSA